MHTIKFDHSWLLCRKDDCRAQLLAGSFNVMSAHYGSVQPPTVARLNKSATPSSAKASDQVILAVPNEQSAVVAGVAQSLAATVSFPFLSVELADVDSKTVQSGAVVVALIELKKSVLSNLTHEERKAADGPRAFHIMRLEQFPTKFGILDVENPKTSADFIGQSVADVLLVLEIQPRGDDGFVLRNGLLHVSRMIPQTFFTSSLASKRDQKIVEVPKSMLGAAQLPIRGPGNLSTIHLQRHHRALDRRGALSAGNGKALYTAVTGAVAGKLATLIQAPAEQITAQTRLADIGMDSMLAVEARREATLGIDVPLMEFMAIKATVGEIGRKVAEGLLKRFKKG